MATLSRSKANGSVGDSADLAHIPDIDLDTLAAGGPAIAPKLSVVADYNLDELRAAPDAEAIAAPDLDSVTVEKPGKMQFVYVHPEWRIEVFLLMPDTRRKTFMHLLLPAVARRYPQICRRAQLIPFADKANGLCLWPVLLEDATGRLNEYSESALNRIQRGAGQWARYEADLNHQRYLLYIAADQIEAPRWPDGGLSAMVKAAFNGCIIADPSADTLRQRLGQAVK